MGVVNNPSYIHVRPKCPKCDRLTADNINTITHGGSHHCIKKRACGLVNCRCGVTYAPDGRYFLTELQGEIK